MIGRKGMRNVAEMHQTEAIIVIGPWWTVNRRASVLPRTGRKAGISLYIMALVFLLFH